MTQFFHINHSKKWLTGLVITALALPFWLRYQNQIGAENQSSEVISVAAILVDESTWGSLKSSITTFAKDIQATLPLTKTTIIPVPVSDDPLTQIEQTHTISKALSAMWHGSFADTGLENECQQNRCELVGTILIGDVPIPEVFTNLEPVGEAGSPVLQDFTSKSFLKYSPFTCQSGICSCQDVIGNPTTCPADGSDFPADIFFTDSPLDTVRGAFADGIDNDHDGQIDEGISSVTLTSTSPEITSDSQIETNLTFQVTDQSNSILSSGPFTTPNQTISQFQSACSDFDPISLTLDSDLGADQFLTFSILANESTSFPTIFQFTSGNSIQPTCSITNGILSFTLTSTPDSDLKITTQAPQIDLTPSLRFSSSPVTPDSSNDPQSFLSLFPFTDFTDKAFLWNPTLSRWEANPSEPHQQAEIWHGVIRPSPNSRDPIAELTDYFTDNHEYHDSGTISGKTFDQDFLHIDPFHEAQSISDAQMGKYQTFLQNFGDIAHHRFSKHFLEKLSNDALQSLNFGNGLDDDGDGRIDEDTLDGIDNDHDGLIDEDDGPVFPGVDNDGDCWESPNDANHDGIICGPGDFLVDEDPRGNLATNGIDDDNDGLIDSDDPDFDGDLDPDTDDDDGDGLIDEDPGNLFGNSNNPLSQMRDIETMEVIQSITTPFIKTVASAFQSDINNMATSTGRWLQTQVDTMTKLINTRDNFARLILKRSNDILVETTSRLLQGELEASDFKPIASPLMIEGSFVNGVFFTGATASDCTLLKGTQPFDSTPADDDEEKIIRTLVEANRTYNPQTAQDEAWLGECVDKGLSLAATQCNSSNLGNPCMFPEPPDDLKGTPLANCFGFVGICTAGEVYSCNATDFEDTQTPDPGDAFLFPDFHSGESFYCLSPPDKVLGPLDDPNWDFHPPSIFGHSSAASVPAAKTANLGMDNYFECNPGATFTDIAGNTKLSAGCAEAARLPVSDLTGTIEITDFDNQTLQTQPDFLSCIPDDRFKAHHSPDQFDIPFINSSSHRNDFPDQPWRDLDLDFQDPKSLWALTSDSIIIHNEPTSQTLSIQTSAQIPPTSLPIDNPFSVTFKNNSTLMGWDKFNVRNPKYVGSSSEADLCSCCLDDEGNFVDLVPRTTGICRYATCPRPGGSIAEFIITRDFPFEQNLWVPIPHNDPDTAASRTIITSSDFFNPNGKSAQQLADAVTDQINLSSLHANRTAFLKFFESNPQIDANLFTSNDQTFSQFCETNSCDSPLLSLIRDGGVGMTEIGHTATEDLPSAIQLTTGSASVNFGQFFRFAQFVPWIPQDTLWNFVINNGLSTREFAHAIADDLGFSLPRGFDITELGPANVGIHSDVGEHMKARASEQAKRINWAMDWITLPINQKYQETFLSALLDDSLEEPFPDFGKKDGLVQKNHEAIFMVGEGTSSSFALNLKNSNPNLTDRLDAIQSTRNQPTQSPGFEGGEPSSSDQSEPSSFLTWISDAISSLTSFGAGSQTSCEDCAAEFTDSDHDWLPDPIDPDLDDDGIINEDDTCPLNPNPDCAGDFDGDQILIPADNCPLTPNPDQADWDDDGLGDLCDPGPTSAHSADWDGDGIPNSQDPDMDGDSLPNHADPDLNGDGIRDGDDLDHDHISDKWERQFWDILVPAVDGNQSDLPAIFGISKQNLTCQHLISIPHLLPDSDSIFTSKCSETIDTNTDFLWTCDSFISGENPWPLPNQITTTGIIFKGGTDNDADGRTDFQEFCQNTNPLVPDTGFFIQSLDLEVEPAFLTPDPEVSSSQFATLSASFTTENQTAVPQSITFQIVEGDDAQGRAIFPNGNTTITVPASDNQAQTQIKALTDAGVIQIMAFIEAGEDTGTIQSNFVTIQVGETITPSDLKKNHSVALFVSLLGSNFGDLRQPDYLGGSWLFDTFAQVVTSTTVKPADDSPALSKNSTDEINILTEKSVGFGDTNQHFMMNLASGQPIGEAGFRFANPSEILLGDPTIKFSDNQVITQKVAENRLTGQAGIWSKTGFSRDWGTFIDGGFEEISHLIHLDVNGDGREDFAGVFDGELIWFENSIGHPTFRKRAPLLDLDEITSGFLDLTAGDFVQSDSSTRGFTDIVISGQDGQVHLAKNIAGRFIIQTIPSLAPADSPEAEVTPTSIPARTSQSQIYQLDTGDHNTLITTDTDSQVIIWTPTHDAQIFNNPQPLTHSRNGKTDLTSFGPLPQIDLADTAPTAFHFSGSGFISLVPEDSFGGRYFISLASASTPPSETSVSILSNQSLDPTFFGLPADVTPSALLSKDPNSLTPQEQYFVTTSNYFTENPANQSTTFQFPAQNPTNFNFSKMAFYEEGESGTDSFLINQIKQTLITSADPTDPAQANIPSHPEVAALETGATALIWVPAFNTAVFVKKVAIQTTIQVPQTETVQVEDESFEVPLLDANGDPLFTTAEVIIPDFHVWPHTPVSVSRSCSNPMPPGLGGTGSCTLEFNYSVPSLLSEHLPDSVTDFKVADFLEIFYSIDLDSIQVSGSDRAEHAIITPTDNPNYPFQVTDLTLGINSPVIIDFDYQITSVPKLSVSVADLASDPNLHFPEGFDCSSPVFWDEETNQMQTDPNITCLDGTKDIAVSRGKFFPNDPIYLFTSASSQPSQEIHPQTKTTVKRQGPFFSKAFAHFQTKGWTVTDLTQDLDKDNLTGFQELLAGLDPNDPDSSQRVVLANKQFGNPITFGWADLCSGASPDDGVLDGWEDSNCFGFTNLETILAGQPITSGKQATQGQVNVFIDPITNQDIRTDREINQSTDYSAPVSRMAESQTEQQADGVIDECKSGCFAIPCNQAVGPRIPLLAGLAAVLGAWKTNFPLCEAGQGLCQPCPGTDPASKAACTSCCATSAKIYQVVDFVTTMGGVWGALGSALLGFMLGKAPAWNSLASLKAEVAEWSKKLAIAMPLFFTKTGNVCSGLLATQFGPGFIFSDNELAGWMGSDNNGILDSFGICDEVNDFITSSFESVSALGSTVSVAISDASGGLISAGSSNSINSRIIGGGVTKNYQLNQPNQDIKALSDVIAASKAFASKVKQGALGFPQVLTDWFGAQILSVKSAFRDNFPPKLIIKYPFYPSFPTTALSGLLTDDPKDELFQIAEEVGISTVPAEQNWGQLVNWLGNLFAVKISDLKININIPHLPQGVVDFYKIQWTHTQNNICSQLDTKYSAVGISCTPSATANCPSDDTSCQIDWTTVIPDADSLQASIAGKIKEGMEDTFVEFFTSLSTSLQNLQANLKIIEQWRALPEKVIAFKNIKQKYLKEIACLLDSVIQWSGGWIKKQIERIKSWYRLYHTAKLILEEWQAIIDLFIRYNMQCDTCKNYRCSQDILQILLDVFGGLIPTPPTIHWPKLPDVVLDLSQIEMLLDIQWPTLHITQVPLQLPSIPQIDLPELDIDWDIDFNLPEIPLIPEPPDLPDLPDIPQLPLPGLPDIPPAPAIPALLPEIKQVIEITGRLLDILCFIYRNHTIPLFPGPQFWGNSEDEGTQSLDAKQCVILTERPNDPELDFDLSFSLAIPDIDFNFADKIVAGVAVNFIIEISPFSAVKDLADEINSLVTDFINGTNESAADLLPAEFDLADFEVDVDVTVGNDQSSLTPSRSQFAQITPTSDLDIILQDWAQTPLSTISLTPTTSPKTVATEIKELRTLSKSPPTPVSLPSDSELFPETTSRTVSRILAQTDLQLLKNIINQHLEDDTLSDLAAPLTRGTLASSLDSDSPDFVELTLDPTSDFFISSSTPTISPDEPAQTSSTCSQSDPIARSSISPPSLPLLGNTTSSTEQAFSPQGLIALRPQEGVNEEITAFTDFSFPLPLIAFDFDGDGSLCTSGNTCDQDIVFAHDGSIYFKEFHKIAWTKQTQTGPNSFERTLVSSCGGGPDSDLLNTNPSSSNYFATGAVVLCDPPPDDLLSSRIDLPGVAHFSSSPAVASSLFESATTTFIQPISSLSSRPIGPQLVEISFPPSLDESQTAGYLLELRPHLFASSPQTNLLFRPSSDFAQLGTVQTFTGGTLLDADFTEIPLQTNLAPDDSLTLLGSGSSAEITFGNHSDPPTWIIQSESTSIQTPRILPSGAFPLITPRQQITLLGPSSSLAPELADPLQVFPSDIIEGLGTITFFEKSTDDTFQITSQIDFPDPAQLLINQPQLVNFSGEFRILKHFDSDRAQDSDSDGLFDPWEKHFFPDNSLSETLPDDDPDEDGLSNLIEFQSRTNPILTGNISTDFDGDDIPDWFEDDEDGSPAFSWFDEDSAPDALTSTWPLDAQLDFDSDSISNLEEFRHMTDPHSADTDNDGFSDSVELQLGRNPLITDQLDLPAGESTILMPDSRLLLSFDQSILIETPAGLSELTATNPDQTTFVSQTFKSGGDQIHALIELPDQHSWLARVAPFGPTISAPTWSDFILLNGAPPIQTTPQAHIQGPSKIILGSTTTFSAQASQNSTTFSWTDSSSQTFCSDTNPASDANGDSDFGNDCDNPFITFLANELGDFTLTLETSNSSSAQTDTITHSFQVVPPELSVNWSNFGGSQIQITGSTSPFVPVWLCEIGLNCSKETALDFSQSSSNGSFSFTLGSGSGSNPSSILNSTTGLLNLSPDHQVDIIPPSIGSRGSIHVQISNSQLEILADFIRLGDDLAGVNAVQLISKGGFIPSWQGSGVVFVQPDDGTIASENGNNVDISLDDQVIATIFPGGDIKLHSDLQVDYQQDSTPGQNRFFFLLQNQNNEILARIFIDIPESSGLLFSTRGDNVASSSFRQLQVAIPDAHDKIITQSEIIFLPQ